MSAVLREPIDFGALAFHSANAATQVYRAMLGQTVRFEHAAWIAGKYSPVVEHLDRIDAARNLRDMRQRVREGATLQKTANGYYFVGAR